MPWYIIVNDQAQAYATRIRSPRLWKIRPLYPPSDGNPSSLFVRFDGSANDFIVSCYAKLFEKLISTIIVSVSFQRVVLSRRSTRARREVRSSSNWHIHSSFNLELRTYACWRISAAIFRLPSRSRKNMEERPTLCCAGHGVSQYSHVWA